MSNGRSCCVSMFYGPSLSQTDTSVDCNYCHINHSSEYYGGSATDQPSRLSLTRPGGRGGDPADWKGGVARGHPCSSLSSSSTSSMTGTMLEHNHHHRAPHHGHGHGTYSYSPSDFDLLRALTSSSGTGSSSNQHPRKMGGPKRQSMASTRRPQMDPLILETAASSGPQ